MTTELIKLELIAANPFQPRMAEDPETVANIAASILEMGMLQTPSARRIDGRCQLAFGHTRKAAYELLADQDAQRFGSMPLNLVELTDLQMFEAAVSENIQRRDLNPIEVAQAMQRYINDFGKTSDECGVFFGMNAATVRGKVRLLDLPVLAQKKLADGIISEGTARSLLSMAKVADEKTIQKTLKNIEENPQMTAEEIIEHDIDSLGNVLEMWVGGNRDGKPRAGHNLWPLDMKNFPNMMLEHLCPGDYVACGIVEASKLTKAHTEYSLGDKNADIPAEQKEKIEHLANPPACNACPFYMVINGSHYCGIEVCHTRKKAAYRAQKLADLSRMTKIPLYAEAEGSYLVLDDDVASHGKAFDSRHADLRLLPAEKFRGYAWQNFKGLDNDVVKLVAVGESLNRLAVAGSKGNKTVGKKSEKEKAEARAMRCYRSHRREFVWEYTAAAQGIFEAVPMKMLRKICGWHYIGIDDRIPDEYDHPLTGSAAEKLEYQRRALVWRLIVGESSHYTRSQLEGLLKKFQAITQVTAPKSLVKRAQEWDAEIEALARVAVETKGKKK